MDTDVRRVGNRCPESNSKRKKGGLSPLRKMETSRSFQHSYSELLLHNLLARVIGKLQIVDTSHDAWKVVVGRQRRFVGLSDDSKRWIETAETYKVRSYMF